MINATELRIGNLVYEKHCDDSLHIGVVALIQKYGDATKIRTENRWYAEEPIPLTEEWLLKFGFRMKAGKFRLPSLSGYHFFSLQNPFMAEHDGGFVPSVLCEYTLKYVHQLQNLYFALTGEEIKINEPATAQ